MYRLLDPEGEVISKAHLKHHLVCVSRDNKKSLRAALHHPLDVNRYQHAVNSLVEPDDVDRDEGVDEDDMVCPLVVHTALGSLLGKVTQVITALGQHLPAQVNLVTAPYFFALTAAAVACRKHRHQRQAHLSLMQCCAGGVRCTDYVNCDHRG